MTDAMASAHDAIFMEIDGSVMEGGGQMIRMAVAFSALLRRPVRISRIRAGRTKPGLQAQHLAGVQLAAEICNAQVKNAHVGSTQIDFTPSLQSTSASCATSFTANTKTAGATTLLAQIALPCAILGCPKPTCLDLRGGTNAEFAPQVEDYQYVFRDVLAKFGAKFQLSLLKKGYFPRGGGHIQVNATPAKSLQPIQMVDFGEVTHIDIEASVAGALPISMASGMASAARQVLSIQLPSTVQIHVKVRKVDASEAVGTGNSIILVAHTSSDCLLSAGRIGSRGKSETQLAKSAAEELLESIKLRACLDPHLQDQVILYMALACGRSRIRTGPLTMHSKTAIYIAEIMTNATYTVQEDPEDKNVFYIECNGSHFVNGTLI